MEKPITRKEMYYSNILGETEKVPEPITREERYLYELCKNGAGGGITEEEADKKYALKENTVISGSLSMSRKEGSEIGTDSVALNFECIASGNNAYAEGCKTTASASNSHAEGQETTASGKSSHAEGYQTTASGPASHAEGQNTTASGQGSHAEGGNTTASRSYSHAEGSSSTASGRFSHAEGTRTISSRKSQHVEGEYNIEDTDGETADVRGKYIHIAGNGTSVDARSNAHTLDWDGNAEFAGDVIAKGCGGEAPISLVKIDKERVPTNHASTEETYGVGDATHFGHLKLMDAENAYYNSWSGYGYAVTPYALYCVSQIIDNNYKDLNFQIMSNSEKIHRLEQNSSSSSSSVKLLWEGDVSKSSDSVNIALSNPIATELLISANILLLINGYWERGSDGQKESVSASHIVGFTRDDTYNKNTALYFGDKEIQKASASMFINLNPGQATLSIGSTSDYPFHLTNVGMITMEK